MRFSLRLAAIAAIFGGGAAPVVAVPAWTVAADGPGLVAAGEVLRVTVPEAYGGKTVIGQLTVADASTRGYVTAFGCDDGLPRDADGDVSRSDLNYNGAVAPVASNRLVVEADADGDVCFYTRRAVSLIVDVNAVSFDSGVTSFANRRVDTRARPVGQRMVDAHRTMRVSIPEAAGGRTVIGQLTVDWASTRGYVTAFGCDDGPPRDRSGAIAKSDLNYNGAVTPAASNRLIVRADADGDICFYTYAPVAMVVDVNGVTDGGVTSFGNRRIDTRARVRGKQLIGAGQVLRVEVPEARAGRTVLGQLTVDRATTRGFVTAYPCADGLPRDGDGAIARSDLNYDGTVTPVASNRLVVEADAQGEVCFYTQQPVALVVDVNAVSTPAAINSFPNRRTDTRAAGRPAGPVTPPGGNVPHWPPYTPQPPLAGVAALSGAPAPADVVARPVLVAKIDNYRRARPQFELDRADVVFEVNVEGGLTRFVALFHSDVPETIGPLRSARTADLDLLAAMNRPVFAFSGANGGVSAWVDSAEASGVLVDFSAQHRGCYRRDPERPGPHDLVLDAPCALAATETAGPARPLWSVDPSWTPPRELGARPAPAFAVTMDGVDPAWTWDATSGRYLRLQDGEPHVSSSGARLAADNVVVLRSVHEPSVVDARSPHPITTGTGVGVVHRDGLAIDVTWARATPYDRFTFFHPGSGLPVPLDRGTTYVHVTRA